MFFEGVCLSWQTPSNAYDGHTAVSIVASYTTAVSVVKDGTLSLTTTAPGVTTGSYQNSFMAVGKYDLAQCTSDVIC